MFESLWDIASQVDFDLDFDVSFDADFDADYIPADGQEEAYWEYYQGLDCGQLRGELVAVNTTLNELYLQPPEYSTQLRIDHFEARADMISLILHRKAALNLCG